MNNIELCKSNQITKLLSIFMSYLKRQISRNENKLRLLPTKKIYDQLNNGSDGCEDEVFYKVAKTKLGDYNWFQDVSGKILKGLCYAYRNNFAEEYNNDICNFLYYWLGDILYDNVNPRIKFDSALSNLFLILKLFIVKKCTAPTYYNIYKGEDFKNIKLFFDYSKDYDTYQQHITDNQTCNKKYNVFLQKHVETYKRFQSECEITPHSPGYCKAFNEYFVKKDPTILSKLTCNLQNNELGAEKAPAKAEKAPDKAEKTKELPTQAHGMGEKIVTLTGVLEEGKEQGAKSLSSSVYPLSKGNPELNNVSGSSDESSNSRTTKTIATTASVAGILLPPFLVYNVISITVVKLNVSFYI
ncbi:hypothetical protein PVBG_06096 [Plasmodium vivax Brazil I]|uniref:Variable surface protein Vir7-like protein n=1 Tax=Plasmodium vivax (strain Brazil I) TaxID=1033975 RepID=A0A0J9T0W6_PLAV1|nr:hypothetical protein PVBG_06096 [Plasmodium vivax Brazil I]